MRSLAAAVLALSMIGVVGHAPRRRAGPGCDPAVQPTVCENRLPGTPARKWEVHGSGDPSIQGFATDISVDHGQTVHFKIKTSSTRYHLDIYRMGYYGGDGARKVATVRPSAKLPQRQPACLTQIAAHVHLIDCGNWAESASWAVPRPAVSGVYFARLIRDDTGGASHVFFVVRDDESRAAVLFQTSDSTWQAYNDYGGFSAYTVPSTAKVSYNRPFATRTGEKGHAVESWVQYSEYPMIRWLESNGYDVSYASSVDTDRYGRDLLRHRVFLSVGHDEYWSAAQRANITAARDAGVNLGFLSGNTGYWKTRWEPSIAAATPYRTLVTYKESLANAKIDPSPVWTGLWRDPRFSTGGGRPENALNGTLYGTYDVPARALQITAEDGRLRLWRNTGLDALAPGSSVVVQPQAVGYEWDWDADNGAAPAGLARLGTTDALPFAHDLTMYRAPSGARVFSAGSVQWSWGLDGHHDGSWTGTPVPPPDVRVQQATVNLLADLGARPETLRRGLVAATPSTDTTPPTVSILRSGRDTRVPVGRGATVAGTARDVGGAVAGVEVSVDGGRAWHPAAGRGLWEFSWAPTSAGATTMMVRAVDDSANAGPVSSAPGPTVVARRCPCSLWDPSVTPAFPDDGRAGRYEVGVKFRADVSGSITGIRFFKSSRNTGAHVGNLWSATGVRLAHATFRHETGSGWQTLAFAHPVHIDAGAVYVASYHTDTGHVAEDPLYFDNWYASDTRGLDVAPLHALWSRDPAGPNGVMKTGATGFPNDPGPATQYLTNANFWVDVVFSPDPSSPSAAGAGAPPTGTLENRNLATLGVARSVEATASTSQHRSLRRIAAVAAAAMLALGLVVVGLVVVVRGVYRRRRRAESAATR